MRYMPYMTIEQFEEGLAERAEREADDARRLTARMVWTYLIYHYIESPIRRTARKIAFSGHWGY